MADIPVTENIIDNQSDCNQIESSQKEEEKVLVQSSQAEGSTSTTYTEVLGQKESSTQLTICSSYTDAEIEQLPPAAKKLLERLQFKNPGKKQLEYKKFNPEMSERERKKLRRFQGTNKMRQGIFYSEEGTLVYDDRNICDCLDETCPGCFYPCPQCKSIKCGPVCRCNRRWVYDYVEDEQRTYRLEFPESIPMT